MIRLIKVNGTTCAVVPMVLPLRDAWVICLILDLTDNVRDPCTAKSLNFAAAFLRQLGKDHFIRIFAFFTKKM
jgi:hypothetical protein